MIAVLKKLFQSDSVQPPQFDREHVLRLSTATLLIEVSRADFQELDSEIAHMRMLLSQHFNLSEKELDELMQQARKNADDLVSLQHVTRLLNEHFDEEMKIRVIEMMWEVVYADGVKDHYEEHLIRQIADLLYVSHKSFIQARHKAEEMAI